MWHVRSSWNRLAWSWHHLHLQQSIGCQIILHHLQRWQLHITLQICLNNPFLKRHCCSNVVLWWHICFKSSYMLLDSAVDQGLFLSLDDIKQEHKRRHHPSSVSDCVNVHVWLLFAYISHCFQMHIQGCARFNLFGATVVENTMIESQSSVTVDFKWNHVETVFEMPPLFSSATLVITLKKQWATTVQSSTQFMQSVLFSACSEYKS